eukprot:3749136-Rhodomonas_salina.1
MSTPCLKVLLFSALTGSSDAVIHQAEANLEVPSQLPPPSRPLLLPSFHPSATPIVVSGPNLILPLSSTAPIMFQHPCIPLTPLPRRPRPPITGVADSGLQARPRSARSQAEATRPSRASATTVVRGGLHPAGNAPSQDGPLHHRHQRLNADHGADKRRERAEPAGRAAQPDEPAGGLQGVAAAGCGQRHPAWRRAGLLCLRQQFRPCLAAPGLRL